MIITAYRTQKVTVGTNVVDVLDASLPKILERDIVVVTSKIISICEGSVVKNDGSIQKHDLIKRESDYYLEGKSAVRYGIILTMKRHMLIPSAGIDESNSAGFFILWPRDPIATAGMIWRYLRTKFGLKYLGVIITDSHTTPMRWGVTGIGLSWYGFSALNNYIGKPDIYGRLLRVTKANVLDGLSAAATVVMGEGNEQTPLAVIRDARFVTFRDRPPTKKELKDMIIDRRLDLYTDLTDSPLWKKGRKGGRSSIMKIE